MRIISFLITITQAYKPSNTNQQIMLTQFKGKRHVSVAEWCVLEPHNFTKEF